MDNRSRMETFGSLVSSYFAGIFILRVSLTFDKGLYTVCDRKEGKPSLTEIRVKTYVGFTLTSKESYEIVSRK